MSFLQLTGAAKVRTTHMWLKPLFDYLDGIVAALNAFFGTAWAPVRVITQTALPANTFATGAGGADTKTANANGALTVDGVLMNIGDRLWDQSDATGSRRGLYVVTNPGSASSKWVLTRASDAQASGAFTQNKRLVVESGTVGAGTQYKLTNGSFTLDTDTPTLSQDTAPTFTGTAPTSAVNLATPAFSGTGMTASGQTMTSTDNQTMALNQCAGMWLVCANHGPYLIASNTAVSGAPAVLTIYGTAPTTDAGTYKILAAPTPAGTIAV